MKLNIAEFTNQFGIILFVEHFPECEKFYAETIGLRILFRVFLQATPPKDLVQTGSQVRSGTAPAGRFNL
jgi:hypothetical protein